MRKRCLWIVALGVAASVYATWVGVAVQRSVAQLHRAGAVLASGALRLNGSPRSAGVGPTAAAVRRSDVDAAPQDVREAWTIAGVGNEPVARTRGAPAASEPDMADALEQDSSLLRQRALLDLAARPEFLELLNSRDPEVRKAVRDFFEE